MPTGWFGVHSETTILSDDRAEGWTGGVMVFLEQNGDAVEGVSLEVLGKARYIADELGKKVVGVLLGERVERAAGECAERGADVVFYGESPLLKDYTTETYVKAMAPVLESTAPDIILVGATHNGTTLASSLAIRLHAGLMAHVVDLEVEKGTGVLLGSVPGFGGSIVAVCKCRGKPQMATMKPGVFVPLPPDKARAGAVKKMEVTLSPGDMRQTVVEKSVGRGSEISKAETVVVAGLGCGDLALATKLADEIGAELAVSRPLADKGVAPKEIVVGSTGSGLNAKVAVVLGVSGASHFTSGIRNVKSVIAINKDSAATIFKHADYCVKADVNEVVPRLIQELKGGSEA